MIKTHKEIGAEIKRIRKSFGISQMKLAEKVGVSFQQIQKYEKGVNKISVEMLQRIAMALKVPVTTFFSKGNNHISEPVLKYSSGRKKLINGDFLSLSSDEITLINLFREIENKNIREGLIKQLKGIVEIKKREE